jgi:hypothetical protein
MANKLGPWCKMGIIHSRTVLTHSNMTSTVDNQEHHTIKIMGGRSRILCALSDNKQMTAEKSRNLAGNCHSILSEDVKMDCICQRMLMQKQCSDHIRISTEINR